MPRRSRPALLVLAAVLVTLLPLGAGVGADPVGPRDAPFLVGYGQASTTPPGRACLGGYTVFCGRPAIGVKDEPLAQAIAIRSASTGETVVLARLTSFGSFAAYGPEFGDVGIDAMRTRLAADTGVPAGQVVVASDHSHAGLDTIGIAGGATAEQLRVIADGVVAAGVQAVEALEPATLEWAAVDGPPLETSYGPPPTDDAVADNEFRALFARGTDGEPIATLVNYSTHATVCGKCDDQLSGDWVAWAAQEIQALTGAPGMAMVGALGATDWRKASGSIDDKEAEARDRLRTLLAEALDGAVPVTGDEVAGETVMIQEQLTAPAYALTYGPAGLPQQAGEFTIDRSPLPPYVVGTVIGTYAAAVRIGDVFMGAFPGEPFPQNHTAIADGGVEGPAVHFTLGAAQDFLGYMAADDESYLQTTENGATNLAGCPEDEAAEALGIPHDPSCTGHWTLQVSPTIGRHTVCTIQDIAERIGFRAGERITECVALTATDGLAP